MRTMVFKVGYRLTTYCLRLLRIFDCSFLTVLSLDVFSNLTRRSKNERLISYAARLFSTSQNRILGHIRWAGYCLLNGELMIAQCLLCMFTPILHRQERPTCHVYEKWAMVYL